MGTSCKLIPEVNGKDSRLFKDLLSFTNGNRGSAKLVYSIVTNSNIAEGLDTDENGEPQIMELLAKTDVLQFMPIEAVMRKIESMLNTDVENISDREGLIRLIDKVTDFNATSGMGWVFRAVIEDSATSKNGMEVKLYPATEEVIKQTSDRVYNRLLNRRLENILSSNGISIGYITKLEEKQGINGVTDFNAERAADGTIQLIRLAKGIRGERALPEEFSHAAIAGMKDNTLVQRLLKALSSEEVVKEILGEEYESYKEAYHGDIDMLAEEAAGKLLYNALMEGYTYNEEGGLVARVQSAVMKTFSKMDADKIENAKIEAANIAYELSRELMKEDNNNIPDLKIERTKKKLYQISTVEDKLAKAANKVLDTEIKRYKVFKDASRTQKEAMYAGIKDIEDSIAAQKFEVAIHQFASNASKMLPKVIERMYSFNDNGMSIKEKAETLINLKNYIYSYSAILGDLNMLKYEGIDLGNETLINLQNITATIADCKALFKKYAKSTFRQFLEPYFNSTDTFRIPFGKYAGEELTLDKLLEVADKDIDWVDMMLGSMANSSNYLLRIIDQVVKKQKNKGRLEAIDLSKKILSIGEKYRQRTGSTDYSWMFEKDDEGKKTGNYISAVNKGLYEKEWKAFKKSVQEKYGTGEEAKEARQREYTAWKQTHYLSQDRYQNKEFHALMSDRAKKEFYDSFMAAKKEVDAKYGFEKEEQNLKMVAIEKDFIERANSQGLIKAVQENFNDAFQIRNSDTEYAKNKITDFEGNEVDFLPKFFTSIPRNGSIDDMSEDVISTLIAYTSKACEYQQLDEIIDIMEIGRTVIKGTGDIEGLKVTATEGGTALVSKLKFGGRTISNTLFKKSETSNIVKRLEAFYKMQIYGQYTKDEGTVDIFGKKISVSKLAGFLNRLSVRNQLAFNVYNDISNVLVGKHNMRLESLGGQFFTESDVLKADGMYAEAMPQLLGQVGSSIKSNKLDLWNETFNVLQDYDKDVTNTDYAKSNFERLCGMQAAYMLKNAGEHWMQTRTSLALASAFRMKDANGEECNLWDATEVVYMQEDGTFDTRPTDLGAKLAIKQGYTKEDGTEFTEEDIYAFTRKSAAINQKMHGIYNNEDKNMAQATAVGRLAMLYRGWIVPGIQRRYKNAYYNYDLQEMEEGYYATTGRFLKGLVKDMRQGQFHLASSYSELSRTEQSNLVKTLSEVTTFVLLTLAIGMIDWPDDEDSNWFLQMAEYQLYRTKTDVGSMMPILFVPEGLKILKSPAAGINQIESTIGLVGLLNPYNYETFAGEDAVIQRGRYEGWSYAERTLFNGPWGLKTPYKVFYPDEAMAFYKQ